MPVEDPTLSGMPELLNAPPYGELPGSPKAALPPPKPVSFPDSCPNPPVAELPPTLLLPDPEPPPLLLLAL